MQRPVEGLGGQMAKPQRKLLELVNVFVAMRPNGEWVGRFNRSLPKFFQQP